MFLVATERILASSLISNVLIVLLIGFRRFLASVRVPGVESDECLCKRGKETAEHVLLHCDNTPQRVWSRGAQFQKLAFEPAAVSQIARQLI
jgi:hypothetical protein